MFLNIELFIILITLLATYFIFELNNSILMQTKEFKTSITRLKKNRDGFRDDFLIPYAEDRERSAVIAVFASYLIFFVCIAVYILFQGGFLFYVSMTIFSFWFFFINFPLDIDELPIYKAIIESKEMTEFLEQLNIRRGTDEFDKISEMYSEASSPERPVEERTKLMREIFEELPY